MKLYIVTGPPCSGKTTYVKEHMSEDDLVFDSDEIARAFTYSKHHTVNKEGIKHFILKLRYQWIQALRNFGPNGNAWLIASNLTDSLMKNCRQYDYEVVKMDASIEECLVRMQKDDSRPDKEEWEKVIKGYTPM